MKMEATFSTELSATIYQKIRRDILEIVLYKLIGRFRCKRKTVGKVLDEPTVRAVVDGLTYEG